MNPHPVPNAGLRDGPTRPGSRISMLAPALAGAFVCCAVSLWLGAGSILGGDGAEAPLASVQTVGWDSRFVAGIPGLNATVRATAVDADGMFYAGGDFTRGGDIPVSRIARWDGVAWAALGAGANGRVKALAVGADGSLYAGGDFTSAGGVAAAHVARWDGTAWSPLGSGIVGSIEALAVGPGGLLYAGGTFLSAGGLPAVNVARWDGGAWSPLGSGMSDRVDALAVDASGALYAAGAFTSAGGTPASGIARWDGTTWSALGSGMNYSVYALAISAGGTVYAGGAFTRAGGVNAAHIASWNGTNWSPLGSGTDTAVETLAFDSSGALVAGGAFGWAGGLVVGGVAKWTGTAWAVHGSIGGSVMTLAGAAGGRMYAGGTFTLANGASASNVAMWSASAWVPLRMGLDAAVSSVLADGTGHYYVGGVFSKSLRRWDGTTWAVVGGGLVNTQGACSVNALELGDDGDIYAGGAFTSAGPVAADFIARWDGAAWSALGDGLSGVVYALARDASGSLYAGGEFFFAGGTSAVRIARWDGTAWSRLGSGMNGTVYALAVAPDGTLYAGGTFTTAGGTPAARVAKWNGTNWSALGGGVNSRVNALILTGNGDLWAGGWFTTAGGIAAPYVAQWNGSAWSPAGSGMDTRVNAFTVDATGAVCAGGDFTMAGGVPANRIARWNGASWVPFGTGLSGNVAALSADANGDICVGGAFTTAGGLPSVYFGLWHDVEAAPTPPTGLTCAVLGPHDLRLDWTDASDTEYRFDLERRQETNGTWELLVSLPAESSSWTDQGLDTGVTYYYRLRAWNPLGYSPYLVQVSGMPVEVPATPTAISAAPGSRSGTVLTWRDNSHNEHGFEIERRSADKSEWTPLPSRPGAGVQTLADPDLPSATEFFYRIRSYLGPVVSAWSLFDPAVTPDEQPTFDVVATVTMNGAAVEDANVYVDRRDGAGYVLQDGATDRDGHLEVLGLKVNDRLRAQKMIKTRKAEKDGHGEVDGRMYEVWMDSDVIAANGAYLPTPAPADQPSVSLVLRHPVFKFNLLVSLEWDLPAGDPYWQKLKTGFTEASNYLYDVTDGQLQLNKVAAYDNKGHWRRTDMRIHTAGDNGGEVWPHVNIAPGGIFNGDYWWGRTARQIFFSRTWQGELPDAQGYFRTIAHEFGHYALWMYDEYLDGMGSKAAWDAYRQHNPAIPTNYGMMDSQYRISEISASSQYLRSYPVDPDGATVTKQYFEHRRSCWDWLEEFLEAQAPGVSITKPLPGWYPDNAAAPRPGPTDDVGLRNDGWIIVDDDKRGPTPLRFDGFDTGPGGASTVVDVQRDGGALPGAAVYSRTGHGLVRQGRTRADGTAVVVGLQPGDQVVVFPPSGQAGSAATSAPVLGDPGARLPVRLAAGVRTTTSSRRLVDGEPPALLVTAAPAGSLDAPGILVRVRSNEPLASPPVVEAYGSAGAEPVAMMADPAGVVYEGAMAVDTADTLFDGRVVFQITAVDTTGNEAALAARCQLSIVPGGADAELNTDMASLSLGAAALVGAHLAVVIERDGPTIPPAGSTGAFVSDQFEACFDDDAGIVRDCMLNLGCSEALLAGYDENALNLLRWDEASAVWTVVEGLVYDPVHNMASAPVAASGAYRVFAPAPSLDSVAPGRVDDLGAVAVPADGRVQVEWTARGDDGDDGTAVEQVFAYADSNFAESAWASLPRLGDLPRARASGDRELHLLDMPTAAHGYYLALRSRDEAGNWSPMSNVAYVVSGSRDLNAATAAPSRLRAVDRPHDAGGAISLTWEPSSDDSAGKDTVAKYRIWRSPSAELRPALLDSTSAGARAFVDSTAADGFEYRYWVSAVDSVQDVMCAAELALAAGNIAAPACDFTSDGIVGVNDLAALVSVIDTDTTAVEYDALFDVTGDGAIGAPDLEVFRVAFAAGGRPLTPAGANVAAECGARITAAGPGLWHYDVLVRGATDLAGFSVGLRYPDETLVFGGANIDTIPGGTGFLGSAGGSPYPLLVCESAPGRVRVAAVMPRPTQSLCAGGSGVLLRLTFTGDGVADIAAEELALLDAARHVDWRAAILVSGAVPDVAGRPRLYAAYPNPFNAAVVIEYDLPREQAVDLRIYDLRGRLVKLLADGLRREGRHRVLWSGLDQQDRGVASGLYFYRLRTEGLDDTRKFTLLR